MSSPRRPTAAKRIRGRLGDEVVDESLGRTMAATFRSRLPGLGPPSTSSLPSGGVWGGGARSSLFSRAGERPFLDIFDKCSCGQISMTSSWTLSADWFPDLKSPPTSRPLRAVRTVWHGGSSSWWKFWGKDPFLATLQVHFVGVCSDQRLATSRIPLLMFPPALTQ